MANDNGATLGPKALSQVEKTVREVARRVRNETPQRGRWQQKPSSGGIKLYHGIILEQCSEACSTYRVQLVHRYLDSGCEDCY